MGQDQIANILNKHYPKYLSQHDIIRITGLSKGAVNTNLRKIRKRSEIEYIIKWGKELTSSWKYIYRYKKDK